MSTFGRLSLAHSIKDTTRPFFLCSYYPMLMTQSNLFPWWTRLLCEVHLWFPYAWKPHYFLEGTRRTISSVSLNNWAYFCRVDLSSVSVIFFPFSSHSLNCVLTVDRLISQHTDWILSSEKMAHIVSLEDPYSFTQKPACCLFFKCSSISAPPQPHATPIRAFLPRRPSLSLT